MPINKETIISVFDEKLTLMQWLKTINKALEDAVLTGVEITKKGNATLSFKFTFEDGTFLETNDIVLQQGESVNGAYIQNGHLYLTLTNDQTLDSGNVKPVSNFSIDANQHLIVNYGDGTSQDLGAIFQGNVNIDGNFTANSIIEIMTGYALLGEYPISSDLTPVYYSVCKNGNKISFVFFGEWERVAGNDFRTLGAIVMPSGIGEHLVPVTIGGSNALDYRQIQIIEEQDRVAVDVFAFTAKLTNRALIFYMIPNNNVEVGKKYLYRYEVTFLLSDNLIQ